jgi:hypothetical protein
VTQGKQGNEKGIGGGEDQGGQNEVQEFTASFLMPLRLAERRRMTKGVSAADRVKDVANGRLSPTSDVSTKRLHGDLIHRNQYRFQRIVIRHSGAQMPTASGAKIKMFRTVKLAVSDINCPMLNRSLAGITAIVLLQSKTVAISAMLMPSFSARRW